MTDFSDVQTVISVCQKFDLPITLADPDAPDCPLIFASRRFLRLTGYDEDEVLGRNCRFLQGKDTDRHVVRRVSVACRRLSKYSCCLQNYRKDGSGFHNLLTIEPIHLSATRTLLVGCQYEFQPKVTPKQVRYQIEYVNVLPRSMYRKTETDQKLLARADTLRAQSIQARTDGAIFLIQNYLSQQRTLDAIKESYALIEQTKGINMSSPRKSA